MSKELLQELDDESLMELLSQLETLDDVCEELIDNWIHSYLETDDYRYYSVVNACDIQMSEIKNDDIFYSIRTLDCIPWIARPSSREIQG